MIIDEEWEQARDKQIADLRANYTVLEHELAYQEEKVLPKLRAALERCVEWLEHAPFDYSNGNTACGVDEGNIRGWEGHKQVVDAAKTALSSCKSKETK